MRSTTVKHETRSMSFSGTPPSHQIMPAFLSPYTPMRWGPAPWRPARWLCSAPKPEIILTPRSVRVEGPLSIHSPETSAYLAALPSNDERLRALTGAVEIGVSALTRASAATSTDFVRAQLTALLATVDHSLATTLPARLHSVLEEQLSPASASSPAAALAPLRAAVEAATVTTRGRLDEVADLLRNDIDPRRSDSTIAVALSSVNSLLNPSNPQSLQATLTDATARLSSPNGPVAETVNKAVAEATKPLALEVDRLSRVVLEQKQKADDRQNTTLKGLDFEESVVATLRDRILGFPLDASAAELTHVGSDNKAGDIVLELPLNNDNALSFKIGIETRDRADGFGRKRVTSTVTKVLRERNCDAAIFLSKTQAGLAQELGDWGEGVCELGPWIATTESHLAIAIRFLTLQKRLQTASHGRIDEVDRHVDVAAVQAQLQGVRTSLRRVAQVNRQLTALRQSVDIIETEAKDLRMELTNAVQTIEDQL